MVADTYTSFLLYILGIAFLAIPVVILMRPLIIDFVEWFQSLDNIGPVLVLSIIGFAFLILGALVDNRS